MGNALRQQGALPLDGRRFEAMLFNAEGPLPARVRMAYRPDINHYQGTASLCLIVEHWQDA